MWKFAPGKGAVEPPETGNLTVAELQQASNDVLMLVLAESFPDIKRGMKNYDAFPNFSKTGSSVDKQAPSSLRKLRPILVKGILRVGGRLQYSALSEEEKHPFILPKRHHVTKLIVQHYHELVGHSGTQHVLGATSEKFWILHGNSTVRHYLKECRKCRLWKVQVNQQLMAPLPKCRVTPGNSPFAGTGVDYVGPMLLNIGRSHVKRYGCIFTCMASRAVHLELSSSLSASSFLQAFFRFVHRRPGAKKMFSDHGSNFVMGARELRDGVNRWNQQKMHDSLRQKGIEWYFNPPLSPNSGGAWESMVKSVKRILRLLTEERILDEESLHTFLIEVEWILNNRPLTAVSDHPDDLSTLTPVSILTGCVASSFPPDVFVRADGYRRSWRAVQRMANQFWKRWKREYLLLLQQRPKWLQPFRNLRVGDIFLMVDEDSKRGS